MSLKSSNKLDTNRYELEVEVSAEDFEKALVKVFRKENRKIAIPGFRKGKAPRKFVEKYYGKEVFYDEAVNEAYPEALEEAIKEAQLEFVQDKIDFDVKDIGENGFVFVAAITTKPEVSIENYEGLEIEKFDAEVKDEDVEKAIEEERNKNSRMVTVENRAAQKDDVVVIDFKGFIDGEAFEGGESENFPLTLGSGQFIPGFEEQVVGHKLDDEFEVKVTFPEDYQAEELKGKEAVFTCKLHEIKMRELPEVDDEFVKDISEFDTLEEYRKDLKKKLTEEKNKQQEKDIENKVVEALCELIKAEIPEAMFENKVNESLRDFGYQLQSQGLNIETYMQYTGMDAQKIKEGFRDQARKQVKTRLALEKIASLEKLEATEKDIEEEFEKIAQQYNIDVEKAKKAIDKEDLKKDIVVEKALNFVKDRAKIK